MINDVKGSIEVKKKILTPHEIALLFHFPLDLQKKLLTLPESDTCEKTISRASTKSLILEVEKTEKDRAAIDLRASEQGYPTRGVFTVGILLTLVGSLILLPIHIPPTLQFILGFGFLLVGFSVLLNCLIQSKRRSKRTTAIT